MSKSNMRGIREGDIEARGLELRGILLIRSSENQYEKRHRRAGARDVELTEEGLGMINTVTNAEDYKEKLKPIKVFYASKLKRDVVTARVISQGIEGSIVQIKPHLRERFLGENEGVMTDKIKETEEIGERELEFFYRVMSEIVGIMYESIRRELKGGEIGIVVSDEVFMMIDYVGGLEKRRPRPLELKTIDISLERIYEAEKKLYS